MKQLGTQVYTEVKSGKLVPPFNLATVKKACPGWADKTYHVFFMKHRVGNPGGNTELFVRVAPGWFTLNPKKAREFGISFDSLKN